MTNSNPTSCLRSSTNLFGDSRFVVLKSLAFGLFFLYSSIANAQLTIEEDDELYNSEITYGVNFNTNGGLIGGFMLKYARKAGKRSYHHFLFEMVNIKHRKERRIQNPATGRAFIYDKTNYLYTLRPMYGRELVLFRKAKKQGVQVNAIFALGPSVGFLAPYLIVYNGVEEQYDPKRHSDINKIEGVGNFVRGMGLGLANPMIGLAAKASLSFEIGAFKNSVTGFEIGIMHDNYGRTIPLLATGKNSSEFTSIFLNIYFGSRR